MELGAKLFATEGALFTTSDALAAAVLAPAFVVVSAPTAIVSLYVPGVALVVFTITVHEPDAGIVPPESATLVPLFAAVTTPPHVVAPLAELVLTRPAG